MGVLHSPRDQGARRLRVAEREENAPEGVRVEIERRYGVSSNRTLRISYAQGDRGYGSQNRQISAAGAPETAGL